QYGDPYFYIKRQFIAAALGLIVMFVCMRIDIRLLRPLALPGVLLSWILLVAVLLISDPRGGSRSWIDLGLLTLQPSELAKLALVNFTATYIAFLRDGMRRFWSGLMPPLLVLGITFGIIMLQPDFGTGIAIVGAVMIMLFAAGVNLFHLAALALGALPALAFLIYTAPYRLRRITSFINPWNDPLDSGWNIIQSLLAIGSGGLFGLGLGSGRQKYAYLPEQHTDFIFSIL